MLDPSEHQIESKKHLVKDKKLAGVIDFTNTIFSDPIYEFLLSFFVSPELSGRGIEERYYRQIGSDFIPWFQILFFKQTGQVVRFWHKSSKMRKQFIQESLNFILEQMIGKSNSLEIDLSQRKTTRTYIP